MKTEDLKTNCPLGEEVIGNLWPEHLMRCTGRRFPQDLWKTIQEERILIRHEKKFNKIESGNQNDNGVESEEEWLTQPSGFAWTDIQNRREFQRRRRGVL